MTPKTNILVGLCALCLASAPVAARAKGSGSKSAKTLQGGQGGATVASAAAAGRSGNAAAAAAKSVDPGKPNGAGKAATYEAARSDASTAGDLAHLLEPLYAECGQKQDFARRQCEQIRSWHLARLRDRSWYIGGDVASLQFQPYDAAERALTMSVTGCISCVKPPVVAGGPRLVVTRVPKSFEDGVPVGIDLGFHDVSLPDPKKAAFWSEKVRPRLRVEYVFKVGAPFDSKTARGVTVTVIGHRVYNTCNGEVIASDPPSTAPVKLTGARDPVCPAADAPTDEQVELAKKNALLPDTLTRGDIEKAMAPVQQRVFECGEEFEMKQGTALVNMVVTFDGKTNTQIQAPYDKGDIHLCIRAALNDVKFPHFKTTSPAVKIRYPFVLRR